MYSRFVVVILAGFVALEAQAQYELDRPLTIDGHPNLNGVWQAMNTANWNLEPHSATPIDMAWQMGAIAAIPAGKGVVVSNDGLIPYTAAGLGLRNQNRRGWPQNDPEAKCYMLGVPRVTYHMPFLITQSGDDDILMSYPFADTSRFVYMNSEERLPVESWMGRSNGKWEGDVLVVTTTDQNAQTWLDRAGNHHSEQLIVTERFELVGPNHIWYEATLEDPRTYTQPWTIAMPLYRHVDDHAQILEHKCIPFADKLLYKDLLGLEEDEE